MSDFGELVNEFGPWGAMLVVVCVCLWAILRYVKTKIDTWGEPWVQSQIALSASLKDSTESQARSLEIMATSIKAIKESTDRQTQSNKLVAVGLSQLVDSSKGVTKEQLESLEFKFLKLEEHMMMQDTAMGLEPKEKAESITDPKLKMEPMQKHEMDDAREALEELKDELKPEPEAEK